MERTIISDEYAAASIEARGQVQSDIRRDVEYILERTRPAQSYDGDVLVLIDRNLSIFQDANCT
jgi:hypothetical protein